MPVHFAVFESFSLGIVIVQKKIMLVFTYLSAFSGHIFRAFLFCFSFFIHYPMYQHSETKKKKNGKLERLLHSLNGYHYRKTLSKFSRGFSCPVSHQNELLQHSSSDAKPGESICTAEAGMSSRWVEPSERVPDSRQKLLPDRLWRLSQISQPCHIPWWAQGSESLQDKWKTVPTPRSWSPSHHWSPKGESLLIQPNAR